MAANWFRCTDMTTKTASVLFKTAQNGIATPSEENPTVFNNGTDPIVNTYMDTYLGSDGQFRHGGGKKMFQRAEGRWEDPVTVKGQDVANSLGIEWREAKYPAIATTRDAEGSKLRTELRSPKRLPRMSALHETTHVLDPADSQPTTKAFETEIPSMISENTYAMQQGWRPADHDWRYEAMKRYGPQFRAGEDTKGDIAAISRFVTALRDPRTQLHRRYNDFMDKKTQEAAGATPAPIAPLKGASKALASNFPGPGGPNILQWLLSKNKR
jgi:hypothetical protein